MAKIRDYMRRAEMDEFQDRKLKCESCGGEFVFTVGEQKFFLQKAFAEPRRCPDCRKDRKKDRRKKRRQLLKTLSTREVVNVSVEESVETTEAVERTEEEPKVEAEKPEHADHEEKAAPKQGPAAQEEGAREQKKEPARTEAEPEPAATG